MDNAPRAEGFNHEIISTKSVFGNECQYEKMEQVAGFDNYDITEERRRNIEALISKLENDKTKYEGDEGRSYIIDQINVQLGVLRALQKSDKLCFAGRIINNDGYNRYYAYTLDDGSVLSVRDDGGKVSGININLDSVAVPVVPDSIKETIKEKYPDILRAIHTLSPHQTDGEWYSEGIDNEEEWNNWSGGLVELEEKLERKLTDMELTVYSLSLAYGPTPSLTKDEARFISRVAAPAFYRGNRSANLAKIQAKLTDVFVNAATS